MLLLVMLCLTHKIQDTLLERAINEYVAQALEIPPAKCPNNIGRYGNCSAASTPMLLDENRRSGNIKAGDLVAMTTFGSGFSWTSGVVRL